MSLFWNVWLACKWCFCCINNLFRLNQISDSHQQVLHFRNLRSWSSPELKFDSELKKPCRNRTLPVAVTSSLCKQLILPSLYLPESANYHFSSINRRHSPDTKLQKPLNKRVHFKLYGSGGCKTPNPLIPSRVCPCPTWNSPVRGATSYDDEKAINYGQHDNLRGNEAADREISRLSWLVSRAGCFFSTCLEPVAADSKRSSWTGCFRILFMKSTVRRWTTRILGRSFNIGS